MHKLIAVLLLAAATSYKPVNPQLVQRRDAIAANLSPSARQKLHTVATSLASAPAITDGTTNAAIISTFGNLNGADIEALAFIVLMDAAQSAQQDLATVMNSVQEINKQKEALRQDLSKTNQLKPGVSKVRAQTLVTSFTMPPPLAPNATAAQKQQRLDMLGDLEQELQLRIQMLTDRKQKAEEMASNIAKQMHDTTSSVLKNLK